MIENLILAGILQFNSVGDVSTLSTPSLECDRSALPEQILTVVKVNDGDTLVLRDSRSQTWRVRMAGMDTPETFYFGENQGPWAQKASAFLKSRLPANTSVRIDFDDKPCDGRGRVLAHVSDGTADINREILDQGLAVNYCVAPNYHLCTEYGAIAQRNFEEKAGFFSDPQVELPYIWRQEKKSPPLEYWVGDMETKIVVSSAEIESIPVGRRVIFYSKRWIRDPFHEK